jgi:hypothetical protein
MNLDLRKPLAVLFLILGGVLAGFGLLSPGTHAEVPPGFNVNLVWGVAMMLFAVVLSLFSLLSRRKS